MLYFGCRNVYRLQNCSHKYLTPVTMLHRCIAGETEPYIAISAADVLWSFDFSSHRWSLVRTEGDAPNPKNIDHFCVYGDAAFVITNAPIPVPNGRRGGTFPYYLNYQTVLP